MSSLIDFIQFEGEVSEMFGDRLPTLDTEMWVCDTTGLIKYSFFEKPTLQLRLRKHRSSSSGVMARLVNLNDAGQASLLLLQDRGLMLSAHR